MEEKLRTKNWILGIAISSLVATFLMGYLHEAGILDERVSPLMHTLRDWMIVVVPMVPIAYVVAKMMPSGDTSSND